MPFRYLLALAALSLPFCALPLQAAGLLIADGGLGGRLEIIDHDVAVTIDNGIAVTHITQVFRNKEDRQVEALYTFPVPAHASLANFSMWINGKEMVGEVVEKERAREIYNSYKRQRRDPGLLEQKDFKHFEMRIFPIAANAEQRVQISYYQELDVDHDWATFVYPLATTTLDADNRVRGHFSLSVEARSIVPIRLLESPSHGGTILISQHHESYWQATLEHQEGSLAKDFVLSYQLARPQSGLDLVASKEAGEDGYFCLLITAGEDAKARAQGMDYVFLLDISGSMAQDQKLRTSRKAVEAFVATLGEKDRFDLLAFNVQPQALFNTLRTADATAIAAAQQFLASQRAVGGTVLRSALTAAYRQVDPDRPLNIVIVSDGLTEQRERAALVETSRSRPSNARIFSVGVGNEVNRPLLEQIAVETGGLAAFISQGGDFQRQATAFRRKLMHPAVTKPSVQFSGIEIYDMEPEVLPDLYQGSPIRVYGRYRQAGEAQINLAGSLQGQDFQQTVSMRFPEVDEQHPEIERMWAWRRMDRLIKEEKQRHATALVAEIVRLGEGYSIASEYTSFLVLENDQEYQRWKLKRRNVLRIQKDRQAQARLRAELDAMREIKLAGLGPEVLHKTKLAKASPQPSAAQPQPTASPPRRERRSVDLNFGSGPVGPLFLLLSGWLVRRKRLRHHAQ